MPLYLSYRTINMNLIKGILRISVRIIVEIFHRLVFNILDTVFGFLGWPEKKMRIKIFILSTERSASVSQPDLDKAINYTGEVFKKKFNVRLLPVGKNGSLVGKLNKIVPVEALYTSGGAGALGEEFKVAGNFFAANLVAPVYPITVFIVTDIKGASG